MDGAINYTLRKAAGVCPHYALEPPLYLLLGSGSCVGHGQCHRGQTQRKTPRTASALAEVCWAGTSVFNPVHGLGPECGGPLTAHPDVDLVSFTGGTATGRLVAAAAPRFKLSWVGRKNATIVFGDCDLESTAAGAAQRPF